MKKIFSLIVVMVILISGMQSVFANVEGDISISFKVGDSVLAINGKDVEVTTPYVVEGVTLVPVRVITEAFGAEVDWVDETQEIKVTYQDVLIELQIENKYVYVNGQRQELLYPPQLTNSTTMVPLRFISENFGADVKYDDATQAITIFKAKAEENPVDIEQELKKLVKPYVGDSYFKWSMKTVEDMEVAFRQFDGRRTEFSFEDDAQLFVSIYDNTTNESFEAAKIKEHDTAKNFTLVGQKVFKTPGGTEYVSTQFRDKETFCERRLYLSGDKVVIVSLTYNWDSDQKTKDKYTELLDGFDFKYLVSDTEDLSEVENGMRLFKQKDFNLELRIPASWRDVSDSNKINNFDFYDFDKEGKYLGSVRLSIYSKESGVSVSDWASRDLNRNKTHSNPDLYTYSELKTMNVGTQIATYYSCDSKSGGNDYVQKDIFWGLGEYVYNLNIEVLKSNESTIQNIVNTVKFEEIDPNKVGILYVEALSENEDAVVSTVKNTSDKFTINIPASWSNNNNSEFYDSMKGIYVRIGKVDATGPITKNGVDNVVSEDEKKEGTKITKKTTSVLTQDLSSSVDSAYMYEMKHTENDFTLYIIPHIINSGKKVFIIYVSIPEASYSEATKDTIAKIVKSFEVQ